MWEEVSGSHFYTLLSIQTGLYNGAQLADRLDDPKAAAHYRAKAEEISPILDKFYDPKLGLIRVSSDHTPGRKGNADNAYVDDPMYGKDSSLDTAVILAILHAGQGTQWEQSDKVAATLDKLIEVFKPVYALNKGRAIPALGRYPEDKYDGVGITGAHPWFLCTLGVAEYVYKLAKGLEASGVAVTGVSAGFYARFGLKEGDELKAGSEELKKLQGDLIAFADEFVRVVKEVVPKDGSMSEQYDKKTGRARGARDLTYVPRRPCRDWCWPHQLTDMSFFLSLWSQMVLRVVLDGRRGAPRCHRLSGPSGETDEVSTRTSYDTKL